MPRKPLDYERPQVEHPPDDAEVILKGFVVFLVLAGVFIIGMAIMFWRMVRT